MLERIKRLLKPNDIAVEIDVPKLNIHKQVVKRKKRANNKANKNTLQK